MSAVLLALFVSVAAYAHAGHVHKYLGTVKSLSGSELTIVSTARKEIDIVLTPKTSYLRGEKSVTRADLTDGTRVAVHVADDGRTATVIRIGSPK